MTMKQRNQLRKMQDKVYNSYEMQLIIRNHGEDTTLFQGSECTPRKLTQFLYPELEYKFKAILDRRGY